MSLDLIRRLRESEAELLAVAMRCEQTGLDDSAQRLRIVAAICANDATALQKEWDEGVEYERREAAEYAAIAERRARREQEDAELHEALREAGHT